MKRDPALAAILDRRGMVVRIAQACGVSHSAVSQWRQVPARHLRTVAQVADVSLDSLVPTEPAARSSEAA